MKIQKNINIRSEQRLIIRLFANEVPIREIKLCFNSLRSDKDGVDSKLYS